MIVPGPERSGLMRDIASKQERKRPKCYSCRMAGFPAHNALYSRETDLLIVRRKGREAQTSASPTIPEFPRLIRPFARNRFATQLGLDCMAWGFGVFFGTWVRYDLQLGRIEIAGVLALVVLASVLQFLVGFVFGLYRGRFRFGSFDEVAALALAVGATTSVLFVFDFLISPRAVPLSATLGGGLAAFVLMGATRYVWRHYLERMRRPPVEGRKRLLVLGAGDAGSQVVTAMLRDPESPYVPIALLDDDRGKRHLRIMGVPVEGARGDLAMVARRRRADGLLIAIPSASGELIGELTALAAEAELKVTVLPPVAELLGGGVSLKDIRPVTEADLLGRREIDTDIASIAGYLTGRRVLVTGAGGSIGSEICRQINRFAPAALIMLDRDESALLEVQLSIDGQGRLDSDELFLADIRHPESVRRVFREHRPDVVFHAAALKHVPLLERHPAEAVRTNICGTLTILEASAEHHVKRFVNISTDKAADPANVLGYSKRICERLTAHFADHNGGVFLSVRFGNVLGSRGSVLQTFGSQIAAGGLVTVTHPDATRFFMTVEEAVQLVIQAAAVGRDGEVLVLDMGTPVRIADVARRLVAQADRPTRIEYTGLRVGEKLHETLFGEGEADQRPIHELISHIAVPPLDPEIIGKLDHEAPVVHLRRQLEALCRVEPETWGDLKGFSESETASADKRP